MDSTENVSRETEDRLNTLCQMVERWNKTINLVAASSIPDLRSRHIADSLQLMRFSPPNARHWVDLGSGGGFPGLVIAACLADVAQNCRMTLIEADQRKVVFLREAARAMRLAPTVIAARIEDVPPQGADVLSARALAPLAKLLGYAQPHLALNGTAIFPKGQGITEEVVAAEKAGWKFQAARHKSSTDPSGNILILQKISRDTPV